MDLFGSLPAMGIRGCNETKIIGIWEGYNKDVVI